MRMAVIGAGSTYTPELADGLGRLGDSLPVDDLVLMDPDEERLAVVAGLCRRILSRHGSTVNVHTTDSVRAAAEGASDSARTAIFGGEEHETAVITGEPEPGTKIEGPALVELPESTLAVPPGWAGEVLESGTIRLEKQG